jgi:hypothetical protein
MNWRKKKGGAEAPPSARSGPSEYSVSVLDAFALPQSRRTLVEFTARSELCARRGIALLVSRSRYAVGPMPRLCGFPASDGPGRS